MPTARSNDRLGLKAVPHLERATHAVAVYLDGLGLDVNQAEAHVLAHLYGSRAARIAEIHEKFGHKRSTLTSVLDRLERRGLITRTTDARDRRSIVVTLTKSGASLAAKIHEALHAYESRALKRFTSGELRVFNRILAAFS